MIHILPNVQHISIIFCDCAMSYDSTYFSQLKILLYIQKYSTLSLAENNEKKRSHLLIYKFCKYYSQTIELPRSVCVALAYAICGSQCTASLFFPLYATSWILTSVSVKMGHTQKSISLQTAKYIPNPSTTVPRP